MKLLIIEDEYHAAQRLRSLISELLPEGQILAVIDSVEEAVEWFKNNDHPDLAFMDIQLADDISFSIFDQVNIETPVIFTTAYNEYSIKAFKVNSIDYLLKPIEEKELQQALVKYSKLSRQQVLPAIKSLTHLVRNLDNNTTYKERFLLKNRDRYTFILADEIAYFYSEDSLTFIVTSSGKSTIYDTPLSQLKIELDPSKFFLINRKWMVHVQSIRQIHPFFNQRLKLDLNPPPSDEVIVSRDKVKSFKNWL